MSKWTLYQVLIVIGFSLAIIVTNVFTEKISAFFSFVDSFIEPSILIIFFTVILIVWGFSFLLLLQEKKGSPLFVHKIWRIMPAIIGVFLIYLVYRLHNTRNYRSFTNNTRNVLDNRFNNRLLFSFNLFVHTVNHAQIWESRHYQRNYHDLCERDSAHSFSNHIPIPAVVGNFLITSLFSGIS